ncbi:DUF2809 domain-containing protein [Joostella sp.]|uniref:ribosomal maturation YjgA family protein n=1 Tax=Joostella sp. TaxID=2231138 RepID=UPI003A92E1C1
MKIFKFNSKHLLIFLLLFQIEVCIALYIQQEFIRGFLGDVLVIPLLYSFFKMFINTKNNEPEVSLEPSEKYNKTNYKIAAIVLLIAFLVEFLQLIKIIDLLEIQNKIARIIIGSTFDILDLIAYLIGYIIILIAIRFKL